MSESLLHHYLTLAGLGVAVAVFIALFFINAPYGRHTRQGWGFTLANSYGWF